MADHDQRFKTLLKEFLPEFLALFFPTLAERLELSKVDWLEQDVFPDPPTGQRFSIDLVARIAARETIPPLPFEPRQRVLLLHVEIESEDTVEPFRERMFDYYYRLTRKHRLDVMPIAVLLRVGLDGRGSDVYQKQVWEYTPLVFRYEYVGLPALPGNAYLQGGNCLGLAWSALMRWPRRQRTRAAVDAIAQILALDDNAWRKLLLVECVQEYSPLPESQKVKLLSILDEPKRGLGTMIKTLTQDAIDQVLQLREETRKAREEALKAREEGLEEGVKKGMQQGLQEALNWLRNIVLTLLRDRFPRLSTATEQQISAMSKEELDSLATKISKAKSLRELGLNE
jgi:hypothetical protein